MSKPTDKHCVTTETGTSGSGRTVCSDDLYRNRTEPGVQKDVASTYMLRLPDVWCPYFRSKATQMKIDSAEPG